MNDQMYKQNKRVMNAEYQDLLKDRSRANNRSSRRERLSLSDASATSDKLKEEPFLKTLSRGHCIVLFSLVLDPSLLATPYLEP